MTRLKKKKLPQSQLLWRSQLEIARRLPFSLLSPDDKPNTHNNRDEDYRRNSPDNQYFWHYLTSF